MKVEITLTTEQVKRFERAAAGWHPAATLDRFIHRAVDRYLPDFELASSNAAAHRRKLEKEAVSETPVEAKPDTRKEL